MRSPQFNKRLEKRLLGQLDRMVGQSSLQDVKHAAAKWLNIQRVRASVAKERRTLRARLAELGQVR